MRTAQKRDILELVNTLHQAQDEIKRNIIEGEYIFAQDMLGQCQECAISIGEAVETSEGEGFVTVSYVEEYCDVLYHIHEELNTSENISANKAYKTLRKSLLKIENSIKNDISVKKEMVFLPYKASMWDSLESVWRAADADPECEAYVVPVPYYNKKPDGSFGREHYEGDLFPEDVPIVHYKAYNIETRHPDAAFIHNPYDDNNYVTSVHPSFYSDKLKSCCEKLIYIPYYVSEETNPDAPEIMEAKTGFVISGGVVNSDLVVVQSENTKKLYTNILENTFPNVDRSFWERKIQGLGSPKLDRVIRIQRDDEKLPENWRKIIYTKDGVRKKTIFYNISIAALLENSDMLEKIKDVLAYFKRNQEVALWWRPHPLYESTLASMRPALLREYREITKQYKEEAWGIFDTGVDLEWAIAETDAYYGDSSSVVQLYKTVQKPVMFQNIWVRTEKEIKAEDVPIWPSVFCVDKDNIWFVHGILNILMRYNMIEKFTYVIGIIPNEEMLNGSLYKGIYKWKNKIFLIPSGARKIAVYDIIKEEFEKIPIDNVEKYKGSALFGKIYTKGNYLYCMPFAYEAVLKIDMENNHTEYIGCKKVTGTYIGDSTRVEDRIIAVYTCTNCAMVFDMVSNQVSYVQLGKPERQYTQIANVNTKIYLFDEVASAIVEIIDENFLIEKGFWKISSETVKMTTISLDLFLLDIVDSHEMQILDEDRNVVFGMKEEQLIEQSSLCSPFFTGIECDSPISSDSFYYFSRVTYMMYQFQGSSLKKRFAMSLKDNMLGSVKKQMICMENMECNENDIYGLKLWMDGLKEKSNLKHKERSSSGEKILRVVKEILNE